MAKKQYRKFRKVRSHGLATQTTISSGKFGLKALEGGRLTKNQIEAARKVMMRHLKQNNGILHINVFPHLPVTKKPLEVRMGSGKGGVDHYVANAKAGQMIFEVDGVSAEIASIALTAAALKFPIDCKVVVRRFVEA